MKYLLSFLIVLISSTFPASAKTICTIMADASSGEVLLSQGDCGTRVTPASTFKIPLSLMGFDAGYLASANAPVLPFKTGYPDWGGSNWTWPTDPQRWMKYSVAISPIATGSTSTYGREENSRSGAHLPTPTAAKPQRRAAGM